MVVLLGWALSGCLGSAPIPTVSSIAMAQTAQSLTQNAPPSGFETVSFPLIDTHLHDQPAWEAHLSITFDGVLTANQQKSTGTLDAQIFGDELSSARRVLFKADGSAFGINDERALEAVRLSNDYYMVVQSTCAQVTDAASRQIADLSAGTLFGGVKSARFSGQKGMVNALTAWEYAFTPDAVTVPIVHVAAGGSAHVAAGDLWVAASLNTVARFTLTVNVQNATLLQSDQQVSGQLREVYELRSVGTLHNISVPFGC